MILPGTGRGTSRRLVEGEGHEAHRSWRTPSTPAFGGGPPPRAGKDQNFAPARTPIIRGVIGTA